MRRVAQEAQQEIRELVRSGCRRQEEDDVVLPQLILLKSEDNDPSLQWERDELDEMEARYQEMMRGPDEDE